MKVIQYCVDYESGLTAGLVGPKCLKLHTDLQDSTNGVILSLSRSSVSVVIPDWSCLLYLINQSLTF